jgi:hypothetical protein
LKKCLIIPFDHDFNAKRLVLAEEDGVAEAASDMVEVAGGQGRRDRGWGEVIDEGGNIEGGPLGRQLRLKVEVVVLGVRVPYSGFSGKLRVWRAFLWVQGGLKSGGKRPGVGWGKGEKNSRKTLAKTWGKEDNKF